MVDLVALLAGLAVGTLAALAVVAARRGAPPVVAAPAPARRPEPPPRPSAPAPRPAPPAPPRAAPASVQPPPAPTPAASAGRIGPARLELEDGSAGVDLGDEPVTLGRGRDQALRVADTRASRAHAVVRRRSKGRPGWEVRDEGSANGTTLNGHRIPDGRVAPLRDGDRIGIGGTTLVYREGGAGRPAPPGGPDATQVLP